MKMAKLRQFFQGRGWDGISAFLERDLWLNFQELQKVLGDISFEDNFKGWVEKDLVIPATSQIAIVNKLKPAIPRYRLILKSNQGRIRDGATPWDSKNVYLHNDEASDATVTVVFLK